MASQKRLLLAYLCIVALAAITAACAQSTLTNPSFENGLSGWTTYTYQSAGAAGLAPAVGCIGDSPCLFDVLIPPYTPDGSNVCGIQSWGTTGNGGVFQSFFWMGGQASLSLTARAFSQDYSDIPLDNGCRVRMGIAPGETHDRGAVTDWVTFPWSESWDTRSLRIPAQGTYTLFIEAYQPSANAVMSTLWDNVQVTSLPLISLTDGPKVTAGDPQLPDTSVTIEWSTDVPCTSSVDYGPTTAYGQTVTNTDLVTLHSVLLTGLTNSSSYHYRVRSTSPDHADWISDGFTFTTPIQFRNIITQPSAYGKDIDVTWQTDVPTTSQVEYWDASGVHQFSAREDTLTTDHMVIISGLKEDTDYNFRLLATNRPLYTDAVSTISQFHTIPTPSATLMNGGFEDSHGGQSPSLYPWVQYTSHVDTTGYHPIDGIISPYPKNGPNSWFAGIQAFDGSSFLGAAANSAYKNGGVFQRVMVEPGQLYTLTAHYATYRSGGENGYTLVRLGIDPNGGVDPNSPDVQWWSGYSDTNDNQWHGAAVTAIANNSVITVFLDIRQKFTIDWHVVAIDGVSLDVPKTMSVSQLKTSQGKLGATLENKIVTLVSPNIVSYHDTLYTKIYVEDDDRTAGLAVLLPTDSLELPSMGDRITVTGALGIYDKEAALVGEVWSVDHTGYPLPAPLGMPLRSLGKASPNQPALYDSIGLCTVGLRVRVWGRVKWVSAEGATATDMAAYIDDGSAVTDPSGVTGLRTWLRGKLDSGVYTGDYIAITGVLTIELIDPDGWPGNSDDYYTYAIITGAPEDWNVIYPDYPSGAVAIPSN